jgi:hypothetical protein
MLFASLAIAEIPILQNSEVISTPRRSELACNFLATAVWFVTVAHNSTL